MKNKFCKKDIIGVGIIIAVVLAIVITTCVMVDRSHHTTVRIVNGKYSHSTITQELNGVIDINNDTTKTIYGVWIKVYCKNGQGEIIGIVEDAPAIMLKRGETGRVNINEKLPKGTTEYHVFVDRPY